MNEANKKYDLNCVSAAPILSMAPATIRKWAAEGRIPHRRYSRKTIRFNREELLEWAAQKQNAKGVANE